MTCARAITLWLTLQEPSYAAIRCVVVELCHMRRDTAKGMSSGLILLRRGALFVAFWARIFPCFGSDESRTGRVSRCESLSNQAAFGGGEGFSAVDKPLVSVARRGGDEDVGGFPAFCLGDVPAG